MKSHALILALVLVFASVASAHLCNDVFDQAEDNLAVKVDIRDGQLRIDEEATFRVYLLNTMDRNIADIDLQIISDEFDATVTPSSSWSTFPVLKTVNAGGQKEYFEVKLMRKEGVADGEYEIKLKLVNGRDDSMVYKTLDLASSAATTDVPEADDVTVDGDVTRDEWGDAVVVTDLHRYVRENRYFCNAKAEDQPRFRVQADSETLFIATTLQGGDDASDDAAVIHLARDLDGQPISIALDRLTKEVRCYRGMERSEEIADAIEVVFDEDGKTVECAIPLSVLELADDQSSILMNFSRQMTVDDEDMSCYWQGNASSRFDPVVYAEFVLASLSDDEDAESDE